MDSDYLQLSGIMQCAFCARRWALIYLENSWSDNWRTVDGSIMHERAHDELITQTRGKNFAVNAMKVCSHRLKISGECDVVEFIKDNSGVEINGRDGKYHIVPIEYKRGKKNQFNTDELQLCAEAICLEEMLNCKIEQGSLFYGEPHRRYNVDFSIELRQKVESTVEKMYEILKTGQTPRANYKSFCRECSLLDVCLPKLNKAQSPSDYIAAHLGGE